MQVTAEKLAWEISKEHGIDLVTILPTLVIGQVCCVAPALSAFLSPECSLTPIRELQACVGTQGRCDKHPECQGTPSNTLHARKRLSIHS